MPSSTKTIKPSVIIVAYEDYRFVTVSRYRSALPRVRSELKAYRHSNPQLQDLYIQVENEGNVEKFTYECTLMPSMDKANICKAVLISKFRRDGYNVINLR